MQFINIKKLVLSLLVCCSVIFIFAGIDARADVPENQVAEVNHLINFVKTSDCVLNRNGTDHLGEKSVAHIQKKYKYFREKIKSTEDFIEYSATKKHHEWKILHRDLPWPKGHQFSRLAVDGISAVSIPNSVKIRWGNFTFVLLIPTTSLN